MNLSEPDILQALMKWRTRLSATAWLVVRDTHAAEDIFQNVALKAMTREVSFESEGALLSWAFITARREGIDWLRRHQREALGLSEGILVLLEQEWRAAPAKPVGARIDALRECLAAAPQSARQLLRLRYFDGYSCDAWIELTLRGGTRLTMAGHSTVRLLEDAEGRSCFKLLTGNLWVSPASEPALEAAVVHTPAAVIEALGAQFDLQSTAAESLVRVNTGSVRVTRNADGAAVDVSAGQQVQISVNRAEPLVVTAQPLPVAAWSCDLARVPEVILGRWLPPAPFEGPRLGAAPLLWPLPDREPVTLYAVALAVARSSDRPVLLEAGSRLVFRGRTDRSQTVRFGFSTQKMRGVFAGKFEMDVRPDSLGPAGETWEVSLPLSEFRPLQPQLSFSPEGLELTDVYALTIQEDAGLEIHHLELVPVRSLE